VGFTVWDAKVITPHDADNTDGIDPTGSTNVTITNSYISDGDDDIAVGSSSTTYPAANITVSNNHIYGDHGVSIGSIINGGISNMLVDHVNFAGTVGDNFATALRIKSAKDRGGLVQKVVYQNICIQNQRYPLQLNPFYNTSAGTEYPSFQDIELHNVNVLNVPSNAKIDLQGYDASHITTLTLDNVVFPGTLPASAISPAPQDITITLGPGPLTPTFLQSLTGASVSYMGSITNPTEAPYACDSAFVYLAGELFLSDSTITNQQALTEATPGTFTLNAVLEPTVANSVAPSVSINFIEGATVVGTATLGSNGTLATLVLTGVTVGIHTYTAQYPGDANYAALNFGSVTVTVTGGDFGIVLTPNSMSVPASGSGATLVSLTPINNFKGAIALSCASLPLLVSCIFDPATLNADGSNTILSSKLTVKTSAATTTQMMPVRVSPVKFAGWPASAAIILLAMFGAFPRRRFHNLGITCAIGIAVLSVSGCSSKSIPTSKAARGTSAITVAATNGAITHEISLVVVVQ